MKEIEKNIQSLAKHPTLKKVLILLIIILVAMVIFSAGVAVGFLKGEFSERWDRHYMEVMSGPVSPFYDIGNRAPSPHGTAGQVMSSAGGQLLVKGQSDTEYVVIVSPQTVIRQIHNQGTTTDIQVGSWITAIGSPDESGRLIATFIRIMPSPPQQTVSQSSTTTTPVTPHQ